MVSPNAPTVKMHPPVSDDDPTPSTRKRGLGWLAAFVAVCTLAIGVALVPQWQGPENAQLSSKTAAPEALRVDQGKPPTEGSQTVELDALEASPRVDPTIPSSSPEEAAPPATTGVVEETPESEVSKHEAVVEQPAARAQPERTVSRPAPAPPPAVIRRPVTAPRILTTAEPVLPGDQGTEMYRSVRDHLAQSR